MNDLEIRLDKSFSLVAFALNRHILNHMSRICRELEMDLDTAVVWGALAHFNVAHLLGPGVDPNDLQAITEGGDHSFRGARLADLTQIVGLPRETIRRKLVFLTKAGKAERTKDGCWVMRSEGVDDHTREFTKESARLLLQTAHHIESLLKSVEV